LRVLFYNSSSFKQLRKIMNRETWLNELANRMAPRFEELGYKIPKFRVAVGWTSSGKTSKVGGECWHSSNSADRVFEILVAPIIDDSVHVAAILAHELTHAAAGFKHGHKGDFAKVMAALGMERPFTQSLAGPKFKEWTAPFLEELGDIPHARIMLRPERQALPREDGDEDDEGGGEDEGGSSNQKKKQTTRLLKCVCPECGYPVRVTKTWLDKVGPPCCPVHGPMVADSVEGDQHSADD
jgi:hypothetical protein